MSTYTPELPDDAWIRIRDFVHAVTADVDARLSYPTASIINAVTHHVDWCVNIAGFALERESLFRRDVIAAAVAVMPTGQSSTKGRRRSILFRVGETLGTIPKAPALPTLAAAAPSAPYAEVDVEQITLWSSMQKDGDAPSAKALVALGLGAGLATRDLIAVRPVDVDADGSVVRVEGRAVPVRDEWTDLLLHLSRSAADPRLALFLPGTAASKNVVTVFVGRSLGAGQRPSTQRMRATWLVHHLSIGTPMQDLLYTAGLVSMDALVRYERFLPPPSPVAHAGTRR